MDTENSERVREDDRACFGNTFQLRIFSSDTVVFGEHWMGGRSTEQPAEADIFC